MSARRPRCRFGARHWFAYYGQVGTSAPTCRRCGAPNPRYRPGDDPRWGEPVDVAGGRS